MPHIHSPVRITKPVTVLDAGHGGRGRNIQNLPMREVGRRRIFVQVDTGNVLGIELDRGDKPQSVKKRVQAALAVPTEQSSLVFGDHELQHDMSNVRNDSPLLLARGLQRSSSTPCLSPTCEHFKQADWCQSIELLCGLDNCSRIRSLIRESVKAIESRVDPVPAGGGLGGAYFFKNRQGENIALVKPTDEEPFAPNNPKGFVGKVLGQPGLKRSIRVGETGVREVAAYLLDHEHFAKVPVTALIKATHFVFNVNIDTAVSPRRYNEKPVAKIASFQEFVQHDYDANDHGTSCFPVNSVHRIGILDIRILNTDRHAGNILVKNRLDSWKTFENRHSDIYESVELIPIDHGLSLPETFEDPYFEWLHWPQASVPFSEEELAYISKLDPFKDADMLREKLPMLREACLRMLILCTTFLKMAASAGLCLADIGAMMSRELCGLGEEVSVFEAVCLLAKEEEEDALTDTNCEFENITSHAVAERGSSLDESQFRMELGENCDRLSKAKISSENSPNISLFSPIESAYANCSSPSIFSPRIAIFACSDSLTSPKLEPVNEDVLENINIFPNQFLPTHEECCVEKGWGAQRSVSSVVSDHWPCRNLKVKRTSSLRCKDIKAASDPRSVLNKTKSHPNLTFLSDMTEKTWKIFLEYFQDVLGDAIANRKSNKPLVSQKLGASCRF